MNKIWLVRTHDWGYCALFPSFMVHKFNCRVLRGLWHGDLNPMLIASYGKTASYPKYMRKNIAYKKIMPIKIYTAHRAARLISNVKSKLINLRKINHE